MFIRWLNHVIFGHRPDLQDRNDSKTLPQGQMTGLLDVIHEAIKAEAAELAELVRSGLPAARKRRQRARVRHKVKQAIDPQLDDELVVEEITDRINDAAEFDPYYQRLFADEDEKKPLR